MWWNCCMEMLKMWKFQFALFQTSYENVLRFQVLLTRINESRRSWNSMKAFNVLIPFLLIEARFGHLWPFYKFSVSYFRCCNFLRHFPWLFLTYGKVFTAVGIFLLKLLETDYFTHLPRSPERSKMTCAWSGDYVSSKRWLETLVEFLSQLWTQLCDNGVTMIDFLLRTRATRPGVLNLFLPFTRCQLPNIKFTSRVLFTH